MRDRQKDKREFVRSVLRRVEEAGTVALKGASEGINGSLLPPHLNPLLQFFLTVHDGIVQCQNDALSHLEQEVFILAHTANKLGPPSRESSGGHEGPARVTSCSRPSCAHSSPGKETGSLL